MQKDYDRDYAGAHRKHMAYEIERQNREWHALNKRERRKTEHLKNVVILFLIMTVAVLVLWGHKNTISHVEIAQKGN